MFPHMINLQHMTGLQSTSKVGGLSYKCYYRLVMMYYAYIYKGRVSVVIVNYMETVHKRSVNEHA